MIEIKPFKAIRYNIGTVDISDYTAPPYDVIDESLLEKLISKSEYNISKLICRGAHPNTEVSWQSLSANLFEKWVKKGVLKPDKSDSVYLIKQRFEIPGSENDSEVFERTGIIALVGLKQLGKDIYPHENVFPKPLEERYTLLKNSKCNFSQVFCFHDIRNSIIDGMISGLYDPNEPDSSTVDLDGTVSELWQISDVRFVENLIKEMSASSLYIADGHHRYQVALEYAVESGLKQDSPQKPSDFLSIFMVSRSDPGLKILPVHRLIRKPSISSEELTRAASEFFEITLIRKGLPQNEDVSEVLSQIKKSRFETSFGYICKDATYVLSFRENCKHEISIPGDEPVSFKKLHLTVLHRLLIDKMCETCGSPLSDMNREIGYTPDPFKAMSKVVDGEYGAAFIVNPVTVDSIIEIARKGFRMPHKSSYFYPKIPSGLAIYNHDISF